MTQTQMLVWSVKCSPRTLQEGRCWELRNVQCSCKTMCEWLLYPQGLNGLVPPDDQVTQLGIVTAVTGITQHLIHISLSWIFGSCCLKNMFICCSADSLWEAQPHFLNEEPQRGRRFLTRAVKHLWLLPLSGCLSVTPPAANCLYWSSCLLF